RIRANTSSIGAADVFDERLDKTVAGLVYSLISKPSPADIAMDGTSVTASTEGQTDFVIPTTTFDRDSDGLTVYVGGKKAAYSSYKVLYPRTVRFASGLPKGTLVEFEVIRGVINMPDDFIIGAGEVGMADAGNYYESNNVEGALQKIGASLYSKPNIYGVKIDINNAHPYDSVEYIDDARTIANSAEWDNLFPFNQIRPCMVKNGVFQFYLNPNDYSKKIDGTPSLHTTFDNGDVMIEIPKMYWNFERDSNYCYVRISAEKVDNTYEAIPFTRGTKEHNKIYLSAYAACEGADGNLYSISGKTYKTGLTVETARTKIAAKGSAYQQIGMAQIFLFQALFILRYKWLNSDDALGIAPTTFKDIAGFTDVMGMYAGSGDNAVPFKFIGIEQMVSRNYLLVDGYFNSGGGGYTNIGTQFGKANITDYEHKLPGNVSISDGYIRSMLFNNKFPFVPTNAFSAGADTLSSSTFYCDKSVVNSFGKKFSGLGTFQYENGVFSWNGVSGSSLPQARFVCFI
ncbi:hypothetical protein V4V35_25775, partial [Bacillus infantis]|uniref:hypothetical protein n=1 Tax=Bacillus infantis TaxID=324767 RepID=UPI002FBDCFF2